MHEEATHLSEDDEEAAGRGDARIVARRSQATAQGQQEFARALAWSDLVCGKPPRFPWIITWRKIRFAARSPGAKIITVRGACGAPPWQPQPFLCSKPWAYGTSTPAIGSLPISPPVPRTVASPPPISSPWLPWSKDQARRDELARPHTHPLVASHPGYLLSVRYCGRDFSDEELHQIRQLIAENPTCHRAQLSRMTCQALQWYQGRWRTQSDVRTGRDAAHAGRWLDYLAAAASHTPRPDGLPDGSHRTRNTH